MKDYSLPDKTKLGRHARRALRLIERIDRPDLAAADVGAGRSPYLNFVKAGVVRIGLEMSWPLDVIGELPDLPFGDNALDAAFCFQVLLYTKDPTPWAAELFRVIRPGGWLVVSVSRLKAVRRDDFSHMMPRWPDSKWDRMYARIGFEDHTPLVERLLGRVGTYHFSLLRKPIDSPEG